MPPARRCLVYRCGERRAPVWCNRLNGKAATSSCEAVVGASMARHRRRSALFEETAEEPAVV